MIGGCGGDGRPSASSSTTEANVRGSVVIKGKKATRGTIAFDTSNNRRKSVSSRQATIDKNGNYTIQTLVGQNRISVQGPGIDTDYSIAYQMFVFDVQEGENTFDIDLKPER